MIPKQLQHSLIVLGVLLVVCFFLFGFDIGSNRTIGKVIVLGILVYISSQNLTLGLLAALAIIAYFKATGTLERMDNMTGVTSTAKKATPGAATNEADTPLTQYTPPPPAAPAPGSTGVLDLETAKLAVQPKNSNSMTAPTSQGSTKEVAPSTKESFSSMAAAF